MAEYSAEIPLLDENESNPWLIRFVWAVMGFNVGFLLPMAIIFFLVPIIAPDFAPRAVEAEGNGTEETPQEEVAYIVISPVPSDTPLPTPTEILPTATVEVAVEVTKEATVVPTATDTPWPTATPIPPTPTPLPAPVNYSIEGITFTQQTWNNCGPANLTMALSYYGWEGTQREVASYLKPETEDKNVSPEQMVAYVTENTNLRAIYRVAGTLDIVRWLVSNRFVVILESGYIPPGDEWYGHYFTVSGYDDTQEEIYLYDSNLGTRARPTMTRSYTDLDTDWQAFNRTFLVLYQPERELELQTFLGANWYLSANWHAALEVASAEVNAEPDNAYAWFNLGTALTMTAEYERASQAFDQAFSLGKLPRRMLWYQFAPLEAYFQSARFDDVISIAELTLKSSQQYVEEAYYYMGRVYEVRGELDLALENYRLALQHNENYQVAGDAVARLEGV
jgi:hypothetical protein